MKSWIPVLVIVLTWASTAVPIYFAQKSTKDEWAKWALARPRAAGFLMIVEALGANSAKLFRGLALFFSGNPLPVIAASLIEREALPEPVSAAIPYRTRAVVAPVVIPPPRETEDTDITPLVTDATPLETPTAKSDPNLDGSEIKRLYELHLKDQPK